MATFRSWLGASAAFLLVSAAGIAASWHLTLGFRAWTSEDVRRIQVVETPVLLPPIELISSAGQRFVPWNSSEQLHRVYLLDFVYTRCQTLCSILGSQFFQLQQSITDADPHLALLTISFDPQHDTPAELKSYAARMQAGALWTIAVPSDERSLRKLLRAAGIVVIDDEIGGFAHNGAILVVTTSGRLLRIFDYTDYRDALAFARSVAG